MKKIVSSNRKLTILVAAHVAWLALICLLGAWWGRLVLRQAAKIEELETASGQPGLAHAYWARTQHMLFWESSTYFALVLLSAGFIFWVYWRDMRRARGIQAFFASVTHELRTPLTSIRLQAESIAEGFSESSRERALVDRLMEDTLRLESQVERTLELARVEGGGPVFVQQLQLKPWLERMLQGWRSAYPNRVEIDSSGVEDVAIEADPASLQIILKNLVENSIRHSKLSPVRIAIRTRASSHGITLLFEDNGGGYDGNARELGRLFHRGASSQGSGVGLYLVQTLMRKMGGKAAFAAASGFSVRLDFVPERGQDARAAGRKEDSHAK